MQQFSERLDALCINSLRVLAIDAVQAANSGHPGLPLGASPIVHTIWSRWLKFSSSNPSWIDRDRFILSAGHGSALLYAVLHLSGYELPLEELRRFRQLGSMTPGHPELGLTPGVEMATGPLGQGFATAVGMAMAERFLASKYNRSGHPVIDHFTYVLASDGDLMEGISNEAASLAGHQRLGKLIVLYDDNNITIDGKTDLCFSERVCDRFQALGWHTLRVNGMDVSEVDKAIAECRQVQDMPSLVACNTTIGFGSPNKAGSSKSHGSPLGTDEVRLTKEALGVPVEPEFWIAPEAAEAYRSLAESGKEREMDWKTRFEAYRSLYPSEAAELESVQSGTLPVGLASGMPTFDDKIQTRQASGRAIQFLSDRLPTLVGGSADLAESNQTLIEDSTPMQAGSPSGRNIYFGVREHAMAAAVNGLNLHGGTRAFGASFLIFSDYCRPSIRLAALMRVPSIFVFTHDSIGVGEDGPTHQPIEHLMSLRAIPNLNVMRPADGNETSACWIAALELKETPSILALTRQPVPATTPNTIETHPAGRGAYVLADCPGTPEAILIASGSEVGLAMEAKKLLEEEGVAIRVVSMPSFFLFDRQSPEYRASVLLQKPTKISIEAGATLGWHKYSDHQIGIDRFGESGSIADLMDHFGFTPEKIAAMVKDLIPLFAK